MNAAASILPPKIERTPAGLWLVRDMAGQPVYCGRDASKAQRIRHKLVPKPAPLPEPELPLIPHGDRGPAALGRGPLEVAEIRVEEYDPNRGYMRKMPRKVVRRRRGDAMKALNNHQRRAAESYAALVARVTSLGGPRDDAPKRGISDGGAFGRCRDAMQLAEIRAHIGQRPVSLPKRICTDLYPCWPIPLLDLIDAVCVEGLSIRQVIEHYGWPRGGRTRCRVLEALRSTLDGMPIVGGL